VVAAIRMEEDFLYVPFVAIYDSDHCISEHVVNKLSAKFSFLNRASTSACRLLHHEHVHNLFNAQQTEKCYFAQKEQF
jgi:hypothetical protein